MFMKLRNKLTNHQVSLASKVQGKIMDFKDNTSGAEVLEWLGVILCVAIVVLILAKVLNTNGNAAFSSIFNKGVDQILNAEYAGS